MGLQDENHESFNDALAKANEAERKKLQSVDMDDTDITDPTELRTFTRIELLRIIRKNKGSLGNVPALRELMDRAEGKAPQSIAMTVKTDAVSKLTDDQLAAILANLPNNPMIIPPMPKRLDDTGNQ